MKPTDIIKKGTSIIDGKSTFFLAEKDFIYQGLPILKNSLIYYDGKSHVKVNMIDFGIFQKSNIPELITDQLPEDDELNYLVDKSSTCDFEIIKLKRSWRGIWHDNHFDKWTGYFSDYIERIHQIQVLEYSGISFSSLMYNFNTLNNSLDYFINVKPIKLQIGDKLIELPELLEVSFRNETDSDIIPISKSLVYHGITLQGALFLSEQGILSGASAEEFDAEVLGHTELKMIKISKGCKVYISSNGDTEIDLFSEKDHKTKQYKIMKYK